MYQQDGKPDVAWKSQYTMISCKYRECGCPSSKYQNKNTNRYNSNNGNNLFGSNRPTNSQNNQNNKGKLNRYRTNNNKSVIGVTSTTIYISKECQAKEAREILKWDRRTQAHSLWWIICGRTGITCSHGGEERLWGLVRSYKTYAWNWSGFGLFYGWCWTITIHTLHHAWKLW